MSVIAQVFVWLAAVFHLAVFVLESLTFRKNYSRFLIKSAEDAEIARPWAFNQGFYNLFLGLGAIGGLVFDVEAISLFACACMAGAGIVLVASDRRMARSAALQAVPPIIALVIALAL